MKLAVPVLLFALIRNGLAMGQYLRAFSDSSALSQKTQKLRRLGKAS